MKSSFVIRINTWPWPLTLTLYTSRGPVKQYVSLHNYSMFKINLEARPNKNCCVCYQKLRHDLDIWPLTFTLPRETLWVRKRNTEHVRWFYPYYSLFNIDLKLKINIFVHSIKNYYMTLTFGLFCTSWDPVNPWRNTEHGR